MIDLLALALIAIPATALIDYFAFRKRFEEENGKPLRWNYFFLPCTLEIGCFIAGVLIGRWGY